MARIVVIASACLILCGGASRAADTDDRFIVEDIAFEASCDGSVQHYVLLLPKGFDAASPHDLLVALHGHGSDRWQFAGGTAPTGVTARNVAIERDLILALPDYRARTSWMGPKAEADVCQIIKGLRDEYAVARVFVCGGSMGGSSALTFTALHPDEVDGTIAINGTANHLEYEGFQEAICESFGGTKAELPVEYKKRSAEYWPERFTMPVGITASGKDDIVPPQSVLRLANVLTEMKRPVLAIYRGELGHTSNVEDIRRVMEFVIDNADSERAHPKQ